MKLNNYPFNGWDFSELAKAWNLPYEIGDPHLENIVDDEGKGILDYKFIGPVFEECPDFFNTSDIIKIFLEGVLSNSFKEYVYGESRVLKKVANDLRLYLMALSEDGHTYLNPMWEGMSKIECDGELVRMCIHNLSFMWD